MKIKYLSCDGETEVEEIITEVDFYEYTNFATNKVMQELECKRTSGDTFVVDFKNVFSIISEHS